MLTAVVYGGTGLVGSQLLPLLLADDRYARVKVVTRKPLPIQHPKLEVLQLDFAHLPEYGAALRAHHVYCALGTTQKQAGSREAFRRVDYDYVMAAAHLGLQHGAERMLLVSSIGADPRSLSYYLRTKGELEEALRSLGLPTVQVVRPSVLIPPPGVKRPDSRFGEAIGIGLSSAISWALVGRLRKYRGIRADDVARALVALSRQQVEGFHVYESDALQLLAEAY
jgi:uncharacterized protein YbjT (DUF2867 family)